MRKIVIVLLIVVSLFVSLTFSSSAYYYGQENGTQHYVPVPDNIAFFSSGDWVHFSDSPFSLTDAIYDGLPNGDVHSYIEMSCLGLLLYSNITYSLTSFGGVEYLECSIDFDGSSFPGFVSLPVMNNSDLPLLYRVYDPGDQEVEFSVDGRGYNIVDGELVYDNFAFTVGSYSDEYINSSIAQMQLYGSTFSDYDYIEFDYIEFSGEFDSISFLYPLDSEHNSVYHTVDLTDIDIEVIETPSFLNWLTRSVSAFLDTRIFSLGSVSVTLGVCLLVPLSLYFLVAFLKKFSGG